MRYLFLLVASTALMFSGCVFGPSGNIDPATNSDTSGSNSGTQNNTSNNGTSGSNNATIDPGLCGNEKLDLGETCDPCDDDQCPSRGCALFVQTGSAETCDIACVANGEKTACADDDGCCPTICDETNDSDCSATCGNGTVDPDETCDGDCPVCPPSSPCAPVEQTGDPSTCDVRCVMEPAPDSCCVPGCPADLVCIEGVCQTFPIDCNDEPPDYCAMTFGNRYTCSPNTGECVDDGRMLACLDSSMCFLWEYCDSQTATCVIADSCYEHGMRQRNSSAYCAFEKWKDGVSTECQNGLNGDFTCEPSTTAVFPCTNACHPWESCTSTGCVIPASCGDAQDKDLYCVFATERANATCVNNTCR